MKPTTSCRPWERPPVIAHVSLWALIAALTGAFIWSCIARVQVYAAARGTLEPSRAPVIVKAPAAGRIVEVKPNPYGAVEGGATLFVLDAVGADADDTRLRLASTAIAVEAQEREVAAARAEILQRQEDLERVMILDRAGAVPRLEVIGARRELERARSDLSRAEGQLERARVERERLERLRRIHVRSPVSGRLSELSVRASGATVQAGEPLAEVVPGQGPLVVEARIDERERPKVQVNARVEIAWGAYPRQKYGVTEGRVRAISPITSEGATGGSEYGLRVEPDQNTITGPDGEHDLQPGMTADLKIISSERVAIMLLLDWLRGLSPW